MNRYRKRALLLVTVFLLSGGCLAGCAKSGEKTLEGMQSVQNLDYEGALSLFEEAVNLGENERLIARGRGIAYMGLTEYEQAIVCFQEALAGSSGFPQSVDYDLNYYLAAAYTKNGQYAEAESAYNAILALKDAEKDAYFLRGSVRLAQADYEGAKVDFDKAISMDPKNYDRLIQIYQVLEYYGYTEVGQGYLQTVLDDADKQMTVYDKGRIYYYMGDYQEAAIALEQSREKGGAESYLYLGKTYEAMGDYNYAANVYSSYIAKGSENAEIYNRLGLCEMTRQDYQRALEAFQAGMQVPDSGILQTLSFNEIVAYEYLGEYQKAAVLLNNYLKNYPDDATALREQDFLSTR
ncbi:MAG: tetratricopeptide repeat protein [Candidatus Gastranaerophilales bacterium]|nr:tetratricopeptide repeat protein [Candidatus Gastranaerophilales bacterium]